MAIPFLNNINLNNNELQNAKLHITGSAPAANAGQIYFDSTSGVNTAKYYDGSAWIELVDHTFNSGSFINLTESGADATRTLTADLSATGTASASTFLRGDNTWATVTQENDFLTALGFDTNTGVLTATVQNQTPVTVDLDGRYVLPSDIISYTLTSVQVNNDVSVVLVDTDLNESDVLFKAGTNITLTRNTSDEITIDANFSNQTITLSGEVTGSGTTSISTTVANGVLDVANFKASAIVTAAEGIINNDNENTLPTSAAVKAYVDSSTVGGMVYQGGYNASTNSPDLTTSPNSIEKGWGYSVTTAGTFFGEKLEVGDFLFAEINNPTAIGDWTVVQRNVDIASLTQPGIGNVVAGTGIDVVYDANGTATVTNADTNSDNSDLGAIVTGNTTGTVTHNWNTLYTMVETMDAAGQTIYCDITRTANTVTATISEAQASDVIILVKKVG